MLDVVPFNGLVSAAMVRWSEEVPHGLWLPHMYWHRLGTGTDTGTCIYSCSGLFKYESICLIDALCVS